MTPRIAFALALAFASGASPADEPASQNLPPATRSLDSGASLQVRSDAEAANLASGNLPVIELVAPLQLPETIDLTAEPEELFQRMRRGFSMPNINSSLVLHHQQWFLNRPESLRRMVERSSRYLHHIVEEIEKRGMPMELALLPMVESAYNPVAYSRSHASGLWQFVPATGKQYKLEQNWWVDERRDIVASTAAALDYLQYIYELHGDWHLALASYNWGEGAVGRAINKNRANGLPTDYLSLTMPEETRNYVPKLQALKNVFSNPNVLANLNIRGVPNRPYFTTVTKSADIDVKLAAKLAEMPVQEFVALNPAHNRPIIKSDKPMVIPAHKVETFVSNLEAHEESDKPLSSWQSYTLRPGEKLEEVAPRFGLTVANLKAVNGINGKIRVAPELTLLVPRNEAAGPGDLAGLPEPPPVIEPPRLPQPEAAPAVANRTHTVQKGETLPRIAQRYGLTLAELKQINKLPDDRVPPGARLTVTAPETSGKPAAAGQRIALAETESRKSAGPRAEAATAGATRSHTVRKGETLSEVASRYDMSVAELKQLNKLRVNQVNAGSKLLVAAPEPSSKPAATATPRNVLAETEVKPGAVRGQAAASANHTVRKGETLGQVASRYDMSVAELKQLNKLRVDQVNAGTKLLVAAAPEATSKAPAGKARADLADSRPEKTGESTQRLTNKGEAKTATRQGESTTANATKARPTDRKQLKLAQYTIRRGDTLGSIAKQFRVDKDDLLRWNRIPNNDLKPGQVLTIQLVQNTY
ncbi:MAG: LysM peptidoglycan-binding domain-containing protein [Candidatus Accumulibacter sp.]|uniref:LysM peptidoglycan-binding domain-containing protein n=1 Tax=Accumulibacter sp. TaxID=2053492 RepID=UPI001A580125|nr:LysM peptidoglycan-binding domain-containing protein [Accumulibacter sp.]MBL8396476.1 LysM peptidoglycan-binding domain-containing protein [Accumulibacter sp.]